MIISDGFQFGYPILPLRTPGVESVYDLPSWVPDLVLRRTEPEEFGVTMRAFIRPDDPQPIQPRSEAIIAAVSRSNKLHQRNYLSDTSLTLHAQGIAMGVVTSTCALRVTNPDRTEDELEPFLHRPAAECREMFMGLLRRFFSGKDIPTRTILQALMGSVAGNKKLELPAIDTALPLFEAFYEGKHEMPTSDQDTDISGPMWDVLGCCSQGRTMFVTGTGHVGVSMGELKDGDLLVGLFGIMYPFILRKGEADTYTMVNVAHVADHELGHSCDCESPIEGNSEKDIASCGHRVFTIV